MLYREKKTNIKDFNALGEIMRATETNFQNNDLDIQGPEKAYNTEEPVQFNRLLTVLKIDQVQRST